MPAAPPTSGHRPASIHRHTNTHNALGLSVSPVKSTSRQSHSGYFSADEFNGALDIHRRSRDFDPKLEGVIQADVNTDGEHAWQRPRPEDSRSPCPALNAAANHGHLPRDGRSLTIWMVMKGLRECYRISWALAAFLTVGSFILLRLGGVGRGWLVPTIDLEDYCAHNVLEHNASLTHRDVDEAREAEETHHYPPAPRSRSLSTSSMAGFRPADPSRVSFTLLTLTPKLNAMIRALPTFFITIVLALLPEHSVSPRELRQNGVASCSPTSTSAGDPSPLRHASHGHACAPNRPSSTLINRLFADTASGTYLTMKDVARARTRRLEECAGRSTTTPQHLKHFADSEFCLTLGVFSPNQHELKVELVKLREWLEDERLPAEWMPTRDLGLWENHQNTTRLQGMMKALMKYKAKGRDVKTVAFS